MGYDDQSSQSLVVSSKDYFNEMVDDAFERRKFKAFPLAKNYLVSLLQYYVPTQNLFDETDSSGRKSRETLAETFLKAQNADSQVRVELLKKLGDRSLYISGFFGDSLQRKLVDIDYYADMGGMAYGALSESVREDLLSQVYRDFARRFLDYAEVLTYISSKARIRDEENIMRLYETYARTGSDLAREQLIERGLIAVPVENLSIKKKQ